jgi:type II secretory pathway component PulK
MTDQQQNSDKFLTLEEAHAVNGAMLSTMEKFMTRITISSLRVLAHIARSYGMHVEDLQAEQIVRWIESDAKIRREQGDAAAFLQWSGGANRDVELEFEDTRDDEVTDAQLSSNEKFLTRMTISALQALVPIAKDCNLHVEELTVAQIIEWIEKDAKIKREQGAESAFLKW